jgi:hypothetical protein
LDFWAQAVPSIFVLSSADRRIEKETIKQTDMLHQITWTNYFEAVVILLVIYYTAIGLRFWGADLQQFIANKTGSTSNQNEMTGPFFAEPEEEELDASYLAHEPVIYINDEDEEALDSSMIEAETVIARVKAAIKEAAARPYDPPALIASFKSIFNDSYTVKNSPHRDAINELVVSECERTGTALLTEDEVDRWWN